MKFILYLLLFLIVYFIAKRVLRIITSKPRESIHNTSNKHETGKYENIEDAKFTEIKHDEEKKTK